MTFSFPGLKNSTPLAALLCSLFLLTSPAFGQETEACNRACLIDELHGYMDAVVDNTPDTLALSHTFRETQNAVDTAPGEGVWQTFTAEGRGVRYADPLKGEVGYFGTMEEAAGTAITALRLKISEGMITEAEWIVARDGMAFYNPEAFVKHLPRIVRPINVAATSRNDAILATNSYFEGIDESQAALVMATPDCYRVENGTHTVGLRLGQAPRTPESPPGDGVETPMGAGVTSCPTGFDDLSRVTEDVIDRRFFFDEEAGIVWAHGTFKRVEGYVRSNGEPLPWLNFVEVFEIDEGLIRGISAVMNYLPPEITGSGWTGVQEGEPGA